MHAEEKPVEEFHIALPALHEATDPAALKTLNKMKARIELVGEFEDIRMVSGLLK